MNLPKKCILVVEDDDGNRELIKELLSFQGYEVVGANSGKQALTQLHENTINLILMDISLPDTTGFALMKRIRLNDALTHIPIIALTAHVRPADAEAAISAGAACHISKPVQIQKLLSEIDRYI